MESMIEISKEAMKTTKWVDSVLCLVLFLGDMGLIAIAAYVFLDTGNIILAFAILFAAGILTVLCIIAFMLMHIVRLKAVELVKR
ncbi:MAG: hypothetical protein E7252_08625 [Lachnospira sp.]|nr:hypothetical protein [Lachnospira sp.]